MPPKLDLKIPSKNKELGSHYRKNDSPDIIQTFQNVLLVLTVRQNPFPTLQYIILNSNMHL